MFSQKAKQSSPTVIRVNLIAGPRVYSPQTAKMPTVQMLVVSEQIITAPVVFVCVAALSLSNLIAH